MVPRHGFPPSSSRPWNGPVLCVEFDTTSSGLDMLQESWDTMGGNHYCLYATIGAIYSHITSGGISISCLSGHANVEEICQ